VLIEITITNNSKMAWTAHKTEEAMKEHFDPPEVLEKKVDELVKLIKASQHFVVFTGPRHINSSRFT
jgi:hypothetical protein